ncbi:class I SAM-dependent methyltransferase [Ginsengibacter hankyongi]|uniref:Class I SAM-dependent methyltransferase n=1 Tax=Ginsengibacter hankyongi TaxID=2607284 RepID=A0A5J5IG07_9BACT|nr:class I SAM-dependent methyltransferase [Ginsengibacter hankyongi]KAA9036593.1 class I SAM-dependent methyltransferase [Ginsengibacter hankyongi]
MNWNFPLAFFSIYHEIKGERKYNLDTIELDRLKTITITGNNLEHASIYQACNYFILEKGFNYLRSINENKNITDFGCGKGRAMIVAAHYGFNNITGIDFAKALCLSAEKNMLETHLLSPLVKFNIICDDVVNYKIANEQTVFFFFNPFDEAIMLKVVKNILSSLKEKDRKIYIMYANPVHKEIFLSAGFEEEYYLKKLQYLELSILSKEPDEENEIFL